MQDMHPFLSNAVLIFFLFIFLLGTSTLTAFKSSLRASHKKESEKTFATLGIRFFYRPIHSYFFPKDEFEGIFFSSMCCLNLTRFCFAALAGITLLQMQFTQTFLINFSKGSFDILNFLLLAGCIFFFFLIFVLFGDFIPRLFGIHYTEQTFRFCSFYASFFLLLSFPISYLFLKISRPFFTNLYIDPIYESDAQTKREIIDLVKESVLTEELDETEKKLISSVLSFCQHLTKEVMIPRVDLFSFDATTTIKDAAILLAEEGYSRVPIYKDSIDNIEGIVMYKDVLTKYIEYEQKGNDIKVLNAPISTIKKPALYIPETKKISELLQDFKKKQTHIAIVVDEYGGTEGIITIEDILEDIVGEIADEYDEQEELYLPLQDGAWEVDPRISILDAEEQLGIEIPQLGDYDTIGGYIFHCAGEIPSKGFTVVTDEFEIEVLKSNERTIEKIKIKPIPEEENE